MAKELVEAAIRPGQDAHRLQILLRRFVGRLRVHGAMESEALYPELLTHEDARVREKAERLHAELGPLYASLDSLAERWPSAQAIEARRVRFRIELGRVIAQLGWRMRKETRELYPIADAELA